VIAAVTPQIMQYKLASYYPAGSSVEAATTQSRHHVVYNGRKRQRQKEQNQYNRNIVRVFETISILQADVCRFVFYCGYVLLLFRCKCSCVRTNNSKSLRVLAERVRMRKVCNCALSSVDVIKTSQRLDANTQRIS
jgi:hypothetical protein